VRVVDVLIVLIGLPYGQADQVDDQAPGSTALLPPTQAAGISTAEQDAMIANGGLLALPLEESQREGPGFRTQKKFFPRVYNHGGAEEGSLMRLGIPDKVEMMDVDGNIAPHISPIDPQLHFERPEGAEFAEPGWKSHRRMYPPAPLPVSDSPSAARQANPLEGGEESGNQGRRHYPHIAGVPALSPQPGRSTHTIDGTERWGLHGMESFR